MKEIKNLNKPNFLKKFFIKICRIMGFEIIDQSSLFDNLEFMALAEIYARITAKNNSQDHLNIIIQNLNKVNRIGAAIPIVA